MVLLWFYHDYHLGSVALRAVRWGYKPPYNVWGPHGIIYVYVCLYKKKKTCMVYYTLYIRTIYDIICI